MRCAPFLANVSAVDRSWSDTIFTLVRPVAAGKQHTLLLTIDGKVYSMGKNKDGCLGKTRHSLFETYRTPAHGLLFLLLFIYLFSNI